MSTIELPDIAILGRAGAGKSTAAMALNELAGYECLSIAAPLKDIAARIWGQEARKDRDKLQPLGVAVRAIDEDAWIRMLLRIRLDQLAYNRDAGRVCVDDVRFPNEAVQLQRVGFVSIRVEAPRALRMDRLRANGKLQDEAQLEHESETALDDYRADHTIVNDEEKIDMQRDLAAILNRLAR